MRGNGLLAIRIHSLGSLQTPATATGANPFECVAFAVDSDQVYIARKLPTRSHYFLEPIDGNEYLGRYPYVDVATIEGTENEILWINRGLKEYGRLREWVANPDELRKRA